MKKISDILLKIFAIGIIAVLFAGGISLLGYIVAILIGGEVATQICTFIFKTYFPYVIRITSFFTGIGLLGMYLNRQKALIVEVDNKKEEKSNR